MLLSFQNGELRWTHNLIRMLAVLSDVSSCPTIPLYLLKVTQNLSFRICHIVVRWNYIVVRWYYSFWTFDSGNIVVRWDYSVVQFYVDAEKTYRIFGPDFVPFYEGYFPL